MINIGHKIKYRVKPQDRFYTPVDLAVSLIGLVPVAENDTLCDPFKGKGAFYDNFPKGHEKEWAEIDEGRDFFEIPENSYDWLISNPPYSNLDEVLEKSAGIARKGFAYLLLGHAITPKRLEAIKGAGFGLTKVHLSKVFKWYGISAFCVFERGKSNLLEYDRKVWR